MTRLIVACMILLAAALLAPRDARGQDASPTAMSAADDCDVEPRTDEELSALAATAAAQPATPEAAAPAAVPAGDPVDAATLTKLDDTLRQVTACAAAGDIARLLALYSDRYVTGIALAPEPVPIVPGQGRTGLPVPGGTPEPSATATPAAPRVQEAVRTDDGRIVALVTGDGTRELVTFVEERDRWTIDDVRPALPAGTVAADLPLPVQAAVAAAAGEFGVAPEQVTVETYEATEWPDTSLGCPKEGEFYAAVITPGYRVVLTVDGEQHEYHTDAVDRAVRCDK